MRRAHFHAGAMASPVIHTQHPADWAADAGDPAWKIYERVIDAAQAARVPFALGGAIGLAAYTNAWRNTKDLDLFVLPRHRRRMIDVITKAGLIDYYDKLPYDRGWIYRAHADGVIVDTIWAMANRRAQVDQWWLSGPEVEMRGRKVKVVSAEAMLWDKLYIMQRERCDWPDIMNLLYAQGEFLEWESILRRCGKDKPLLAGALWMFRWLSPGAAAKFPEWLWLRLDLPLPQDAGADSVDRKHAAFLDTRPWYALNQTAPWAA
jgi:hypothetical protein